MPGQGILQLLVVKCRLPLIRMIIPTNAIIAENTNPKINTVECGISHLITVPSTKLSNASFEMSTNNLPKS